MADTQAKIVLAAEDRTARVFAGLRSNLGALRGQADSVNGSFIGLNKSLIGAFSLAGISAFFGKVVNGIDKLNDLADATGSSVEKLGGLEDIGARTGTSIDTVGDAVLKLNKNLLEAQDPTSTAAGLFKQLGLNVQELSKLDPSEALLRVATALNGFEQNANKGQFQLALLGKSTRELSSFLKDLAEAGTISATVLGDQGEEADKFNKQLFQIQKNSTDASRALALELLPSINNVFDAYKKFGGVGGIVGAIFGQDSVSQARATVDAVQAEITRAQDSIERMSTELKRDPANDFLKVRIDKARERLALLLRESVLATDALKDAANRLSPPTAASSADPARPDIGKTGGGGGKGGGTAKARLSDAQQYLESLRRQLQSTQDLSVAETVLADIQAGRLKLAKGESADQLLDIAAQIDQAKRRQDQLKAEADQVRQLRSEQEQLRSDGASVFDATRTSAERFGIELGNIQVLLQKGAIDSETYYRRVAQLREEFDKVSEEKDTFAQLDSFAQRASQNIQDALGNELSNVLDGNFKNIGDSFTKLLNRMVAEAAAQEITRALFGDPAKSQGGSGGGGLLGGLFKEGGKALGKFGSSLFGSFSGGAATGTNLLERDMITLVHKGEAIVPKAYNPAAGGTGGRSVVVHNNFNVSGSMDRRTQAQIASEAGRGIQLALSRNN